MERQVLYTVITSFAFYVLTSLKASIRDECLIDTKPIQKVEWIERKSDELLNVDVTNCFLSIRAALIRSLRNHQLLPICCIQQYTACEGMSYGAEAIQRPQQIVNVIKLCVGATEGL